MKKMEFRTCLHDDKSGAIGQTRFAKVAKFLTGNTKTGRTPLATIEYDFLLIYGRN